jgi:hypothetical protein
MSRIPAALDEMMWLIADQRDAASIEAFTNRYPDLRHELLRRVNMMYALKQSRPDTPETPQFRPTLTSRPTFPMRRNVGLAMLALGAMAFGSYFGTKKWLGTREPASQASTIESPVQGRFEPQVDQNAPETVEPTPTPAQVPHPESAKPDQGLVTLNIKSAPLSLVLQQIAQSSGWKIEIAPGTPDPTISAFYSQEPVMEVLRAIGAEAGFTPLEQEPRHVLIIPATEPGKVTPVEPKDQPAPTPNQPANSDTLPKPSDN